MFKKAKPSNDFEKPQAWPTKVMSHLTGKGDVVSVLLINNLRAEFAVCLQLC